MKKGVEEYLHSTGPVRTGVHVFLGKIHGDPLYWMGQVIACMYRTHETGDKCQSASVIRFRSPISQGVYTEIHSTSDAWMSGK